MLTFNQILRRCDMSRSACAAGLRQIEMLGFVSVEMGSAPKFTRTLKLVDRWQNFSADEAERLRLKAKLPMAETKRAAVQAVAPRVRHTPSLPVLHWRDHAR